MRKLVVLTFVTLDGVMQAPPASFKLLDSEISPKGVIVATYERDGNIKTGSFAQK